MKTVIIVAISRNDVIGRNGVIPWSYPVDMRHFVRTTMGHPVVAGRRTFESFKRRPLPGRKNIVLSRNPGYEVPAGVLAVRSLAQARAYCENARARKMFILGGAEVYRLALPQTDEMLITRIPEEVEGDTTFPPWDPQEWEIVDSRAEDGLTFVTYRRRR